MYDLSILEEELKNKVANDYFRKFDCTQIIGRIDFSVSKKINEENLYFLWAEAKAGNKKDICESFIQLILTIGREHTFENNIPPLYLGAFDAEKIAFIPYESVRDVFYLNDFNWNVSASNHKTKEFKKLYKLVKQDIEENSLLFRFEDENELLKNFIKNNFVQDNNSTNKIEITKNNFTAIYYHWLKEVQPTINIHWELLKEKNIIDADFYLADLLSEDDKTLKDKLFVLLKSDYYEFQPRVDDFGLISSSKAEFCDKQRAHKRFWSKYKRPPREEFWDYIIERRDLLVPQDLRERKGSFFTPQCWVELSQKYLADYFGEDWQDEYYIWDCAGGTGNLLNGLTNKYRIWISTLDQPDVDVMIDRIINGANLLPTHVFQFDFLNDSFDDKKVPEDLREILKDPKKRKKLIIYINPPYAEAASTKTLTGSGSNKTDVAVQQKTYKQYFPLIGIAGRELFAQFTIRIKKEIGGCMLGEFSKLKILQAPNFRQFRQAFDSKLCSLFVVPAYTFDNVDGKFPIGFHIWDTNGPTNYCDGFTAHVYDQNGKRCHNKLIKLQTGESINDWLIKTRNQLDEKDLGFIYINGADFQHQNYVYFVNNKKQIPHPRGTTITDKNLIEVGVYIAVRKCIKANWLNDRDQFSHPNDKWIADKEFQSDCLTFTLFNDANRIKSSEGINYWIPFTEEEVEAKGLFQSHFMTKYISGKIQSDKKQKQLSLGKEFSEEPDPLVFSSEAKDVFDAGRELWKYYHSQPGADVNASLYDIKERFQGRNSSKVMNSKSDDEEYTKLMDTLKRKLKILGNKIEPKVYKYGFLLK